jgi:hypothetical protein
MKDKIENARKLYNTLTDNQKKDIKTFKALCLYVSQTRNIDIMENGNKFLESFGKQLDLIYGQENINLYLDFIVK